MADYPNIVWITLDSVRADHTTMAGYERDTTPNLQRIVNDGGTYFAKCFSPALKTLLASSSYLTGMYPSRHGVGFDREALPSSIATIPERLRDQGYSTACLSRNSFLSAATGLNRGFDRFEWMAASNLLSAAGPVTVVKYLLNLRRHSAGFTTDTAKHATPFLMNDLAKRWLKSLRDESPFFFYLHYNEPHRPYYPPLPYLNEFTDDLEMSATEAAEFSMHLHYNMRKEVANGWDLTADEQAAVEAMYDAELKYTDECIGRLFDHIRSEVDSDTVVVITGDHGELLGKHGLLSHHVRIDDALTNVPLVVHRFDGIDHQRDEIVQPIDLMQTFVANASGETSGMQGIDLRSESREYAIIQENPPDFSPYLEHNPEFDISKFHQNRQTALRTADFQYVRSDDKAELFRLPNITRDVIEDHPDIAEELDRKLTRWLETEGQAVTSDTEAEFTDEMQKQLQDLGYLE